jgi:hypothetical protein
LGGNRFSRFTTENAKGTEKEERKKGKEEKVVFYMLNRKIDKCILKRPIVMNGAIPCVSLFALFVNSVVNMMSNLKNRVKGY